MKLKSLPYLPTLIPNPHTHYSQNLPLTASLHDTNINKKEFVNKGINNTSITKIAAAD